MSDEVAFLRAIQANPADTTAKLVYADWLDEHGESEKAEYIRSEVATGGRFPTWNDQAQRFHLLARRHRVWVELIRGSAPMWDAVTMFTLGRLEGLLTGYAAVNGHDSDISYDFDAFLRLRTDPIEKVAEAHYGLDYAPVTLEPFDDWEGGLSRILEEWLFREIRPLTNVGHTRLAMLSTRGREWMIADVLAHVRDVINPTTGYRVQITRNDRFYALDWADVILEASDRVLFLHFSFSD